jgi:hypothetical protein
MAFAGDAVNPITAQDTSSIDTWWASKDRTIQHGFDDADGYIRTYILPGVPKGHNVKWGVNDAGNSYYLTISGPNINKSWT